jgi:hypothetical protein
MENVIRSAAIMANGFVIAKSAINSCRENAKELAIDIAIIAKVLSNRDPG